MDGIDDKVIRRAELDYCLKNSMNFVDTQALDEPNNGFDGDVNESEKEEEKPDKWLVDVRYASRLLKKANEMRIKKRLCDLTIGLKDGKLEAHKSMLAAGSPFFKRLTETTRANTLNFFHVTTCVADILFDFMYTGEVNEEKVKKLSRSEKRQLREKAELFEIGQQLQPLWERLELEPDAASKQSQQKETPAKEEVKDASTIVKNKVLYMNERRKQGDFADWKIRISAVDIPVSKVFLAAGSTYFADFFARNPMEAKSETYTLTELNRRTFRKVLNFIYTGHVITAGRTMDELKHLLFQACYLGITDLSNRLVQEFESRLDNENCFSIFAYSNTINCRQLFKSMSRYVGRLGSKSAQNPGFLELEFNDLRAALLNSELRFDCAAEDNETEAGAVCLPWPGEFEWRTLDLLIAWIRVDRIKRSSHVTELFGLVDKLGRPPYTGRREEMHKRLPQELNNVMSAYYTKMIQEPNRSDKQPSPQSETIQSAIRARSYLLPTRLLMSREFLLAAPQPWDAALNPEKLISSANADEEETVSNCWQLAPTEWQLQSLRVHSADQALTRLAGLELTYRRYPLFADNVAPETRTVCCGYRGAFEKLLELDQTERVVQLNLGGTTCGSYSSFISWISTCAGRRLLAANAEAESAGSDDAIEQCIKSPQGSRGFLHGFGLRFSEPANGGVGTLTIVWAVEAEVDGLGEAPWRSVVEND